MTSRCSVRSSLFPSLILVLGTAIRIPALNNPVLDGNSHRQAHTATVIREFMRDGFDWRTPLPVFGPDSLIPFEFPLFQFIAAQLGRMLQMSASTAGRTLALVLFQISTILLYLLITSLASRQAAIFSVALAQFLPFGIQWGHASLIEFMPVALMLGSAYVLVASKRVMLPAAILVVMLVSAASLVKVTSAIALMPLLLLGPLHHSTDLWGAVRSRRGITAIVAGVLSVASAGVWTRAADTIKAEQMETAWLTSSRLTGWNFGSLSQRLKPDVWAQLFEHMSTIVPWTLVLVTVLIAAMRERFHSIHVVFLLAAVVGPLIFLNLYYVHDYYFAAVFFPIVALLALVFSSLTTQSPSGNRTAIAVGLIAVSIASTLYGSANGREYLRALAGGRNVPTIVTDIRRWVDPSEIVVLIGCDWDPTVPYLADRVAYMIRPPETDLPIPPRLRDSVGGIAACDADQLPTDSALSDDFPGVRFERVSPHLFVVVR